MYSRKAFTEIRADDAALRCRCGRAGRSQAGCCETSAVGRLSLFTNKNGRSWPPEFNKIECIAGKGTGYLLSLAGCVVLGEETSVESEGHVFGAGDGLNHADVKAAFRFFAQVIRNF